ncbi:sulfite oxidase-like oxidoreductase [uncultured Arthrobacter sp.]|uniref:sulfite oxidase-like oxidoreductase n=1 Tax=uncultured Arthrobacter sp. TaxID=114050 RepID=UPI0025D976C6|nr:sulfite oxidase-like oxidoreductase [uncultured Arthrobacter sp.]
MAAPTRGFTGRPRNPDANLPPGQYATDGFPVLSAGPTPHVPLPDWTFEIDTGSATHQWTWEQLQALPQENITADIHCVTRWSKLGTAWRGVSLDTLFEEVESEAEYAMVHSYGDYTTNLPLEDLLDGKAWLVHEFEGEALPSAHGGPVRLLVPHLYFWKSAKWVSGIRMMDQDLPGFWEVNGYHIYGDPWREERYS